MFHQPNLLSIVKTIPPFAVFLIDFDGTIASGHIHNAICQARLQGLVDHSPVSHWDFIRQKIHEKAHLPLGTDAEWREVFATLLNHGHRVAIVSFSSFPHVIKNYLRDVIKLSEQELAQVYINSWCPSDPSSANKNVHIQQVLEHFQFPKDADKAFGVLIDDSIENIKAAKRMGYRTVTVEKDNPVAHLKQMKALSAELTKPLEPMPQLGWK